MIVQIYEVSTAEEAIQLARVGVDHIGVLVGDGSFPRELSIQDARKIFAVIPAPAKGSALSLSSNIDFIKQVVKEVNPPVLHLGASPELLGPKGVKELKAGFPDLKITRSIPVVGEESLSLAEEYEGIVEYLLLDSYRHGDKQIGALGKTHDWSVSRKIVERARTPVILAGGLGPDNVADAIEKVRPAGVDSKTKTDRIGSHQKEMEKVKRFVTIAKSF